VLAFKENKGHHRMTLQEIKAAIAAGHTVHWATKAYVVILDNIGRYIIKCTDNGYCIGLTHKDGVTMNGSTTDFFIAKQ